MAAKNGFIYVGLAIGVVALAGVVVFATQNQQNYIQADAVPSQANLQGSFSSPSGLGADLNKERWHEDPFADEAAKVKAQFQSGG
jgi:hypothetical protein